MWSRARSGRLTLSLSLAASLAACSNDAISIGPEPARDRAPDETVAPVDRTSVPEPRTEEDAPRPGVQAETFTIEYAPLGFKIALAVPQGGHLCIIVPESAQEPTACLGLDPQATVDALPTGPGRPFGVARARAGDWSYDVFISATPGNVESREDIERVVSETEAEVREATELTPKVIADTPNQRFDLLRVKDVPVVKFRLETPHPTDSRGYDQATTLYYAGYGGKSVRVTFITSPKDFDKMLPYAEASVQTMVLPPREAPERFGKPRAELSQQSTRTALMIFGPLIAFGILLFWWLGRSRDKAAAATTEKVGTRRGDAARESSDSDERGDDANDDSDGDDANDDGDGDGDDANDDGDDDSDDDSDDKKRSGASSEEDAPPSDRDAK